MIKSVIGLLIWVCVIALVLYAQWVLTTVIDIPLPEKVVQHLWLIFALIVLLMLLRLLLGSGHMPGLGRL